MMEVAIFTIGFAFGGLFAFSGLTAAAVYWLLQDEEDRTDDSIDYAVHR